MKSLLSTTAVWCPNRRQKSFTGSFCAKVDVGSKDRAKTDHNGLENAILCRDPRSALPSRQRFVDPDLSADQVPGDSRLSVGIAHAHSVIN